MTHSDSGPNRNLSDYLDLAVQNSDDFRQAEQALRERERLLDSLIGLLPGSAYRALADEHWTALFISKGIEKVTGYPPEEFTSRRLNYNDIMLPEDRSATRAAVVTALRERRVYDVEHRIRHKDGSVRWIWARGHGVFAPDGSLRFIEGWNLDITPRKQAEEELRNVNARLELAVRGSNVGVWDLELPDSDYNRRRRHYMNVWEQLGYDSPPAGRESALDEAGPEDRAHLEEAVRRYLAGETTEFETEIRLRHKDGSYRTMLARGAALRDGVGKPIRMMGVTVDVTDLKRAEEEIGRLNQELRSRIDEMQAILDIVPIGIGVAHDPECRLITHNPYLSEITGVPLGKNASFGAPPEEQPENHLVYKDGKELLPEQMPMQLACTGVEVRDFEMDIVRTDGDSCKLLCYVRPLKDAAGRVRGSVGGFLDITSRRQMEEALRASEERFRGTFENAAVGIAHLDTAGRWLVVNEKFCAIAGYPREELLHKTFQEMTYPDDLTVGVQSFAALMRGELASYGLEKRYLRKDGSPVWVEMFVSLQRDAAGRPAYAIGVFQDISERKRLEEALRASEERYRFLTQSIPQKIFTANANGDVDYFNQPWTEFTGLSFDQNKGWGWLQCIHPEDVEENVRRWQHSIDTGEPFQLEHRFRRADGVYRWHLSRALAMRDAEGRVLMWFGANTDIDDQKRAAEAFKQAKEAAEAANRAKDEFLANVSHEIRTPMNAILGMTDLALDTPLTEDQRQYLTTVKSAGDALLGIINDILDFAKIEAGRLELDPADFSLAAVLTTTLRALGVRAHKKGLELVCQQRPDVPDALIGDAGRLRQVLINLLGNAIKFTERGEIVVEVTSDAWRATSKERQPEGASEDASSPTRHSSLVTLHFSVRDTGIGIPPEKQARIFQAFEQEDTSTTRKYGGTGLGLTIASRLVGLMGGTITVASEPGRGSTFAFTARFGLQPHPPEAVAASAPVVLRGLPVLIVDDNATNRHILEEWLRNFSMEPTAAGDGVTAMAALWRGVAHGRPYPLALLDGRMPDIDGLALAAKIRQQVELSATRIILLSSGDRPGDLNRARQLGISANLLKPLQPRELLETILRVMRHQGDPEELPVSPTVMRPNIPEGLVGIPLRILVAEDNEFNRDLLEHLLARLGLSAAMAVNGREALTLLQREPFDLLLLDIHMPELDGFQVVGAIRERERTAGGHLPVIALTARSRNEDREACLRAGMDEYLAKPFTAADLWAAIDRVLRRDEGRGMRDEEANRTSSLTPHPSSLLLVDAPVLLAACGSDPTMLRKMCRSLQSRVPEHLAAVRDALHKQDASRLRETAHKFCGMLSAFSTVAGDQAASLEDLAARGLLNEALPAVEQLDQCATELARLAGGLTIETLRKLAEPADDPSWTRQP